MAVRPKDVLLYVTEEGKSPVEDWLGGLRDRKARAAIDARIARLRLGQGYRVYFGHVSSLVVLLLCGGDKRTQKADVKRAREFWSDYQERAEEE